MRKFSQESEALEQGGRHAEADKVGRGVGEKKHKATRTALGTSSVAKKT
jgi:hypothetical protein